ncbi:uncharacterized protein [Blastocystis hominis]|uniref:Uncharacterized protein n=1 Tax=Blastocystis hominis TaxID=12968 RepID=D8MAT4_BLAHO|nr:uncharacterized protein [Blastocystis hominis]CBK25173.2 unnamed protein product [Blastocystis hominis]|eukprot:XP_012899221.1 uncharacterized protein [Blastocystis hominis]
MPRRLSNSFISKVECKTRSRSVDLSSLSRSFSSSKPPSLSLLLEFQSERRGVIFQGHTLEELQTLINQTFLSLPLVHVCVEHPSIPGRLVNITDIDQLYDNAVIHLVPVSQ